MNLIVKLKKKILSNELIKRVIYAISFSVFGTIGSRFFIMLAGVLVSRLLGESEYGKYSLIHTTVLTFVSFSGLGIGATLTRYIVVYKAKTGELGEIIKTLSSFCYFMSFFVSLIAIIFSRKISLMIVNTEELTIYFRCAAISIFFSALASIEQSILVGFERYKENTYIQFFRCILYLILSVLLSILEGIRGAVVAMVLSDMALFIVSWLSNRYYYNKNNILLNFNFDNNKRKILLKFTLPTFVASMLYTPTLWVANAMLTKNAGYEEMAIFSISSQWLNVLTYIPAQFGNVKPIYTELYCKNNYRELWKLFWKITSFSSLIITPFIIAGILEGEIILGMYGEGYIKGQRTFILMLVAALIINMQAQVGALLQAIGKMWSGFALNLIWTCVFLGGFYILKSRGSVGYAIAYIISYIVHMLNSMGVICIILKKGENMLVRNKK